MIYDDVPVDTVAPHEGLQLNARIQIIDVLIPVVWRHAMLKYFMIQLLQVQLVHFLQAK